MHDNTAFGRNSQQNNEKTIWIATGGRYTNLNLANVCEEPVTGPVTEYDISEIARYLLNPNPITLEEKVIGCKIFYRDNGDKRRLGRKKGKGSDGDSDSDKAHTEEITTLSKTGEPAFRDKDLNGHFNKIREMLKPYDPVQKRIAALDRDGIDDVKAVCEQISGNKYVLSLQGSVNEKLKFISDSLSKNTKIVFNKAHLASGLFEMRGFDFQTFNPQIKYKLVKLTSNDKTRYCVLTANYNFEYWVEDNLLVNYLQLLEHAVRTDGKLVESLELCINGDARPFKLFFSKQMDQSYTEKNFPTTYRELLRTVDLSAPDKDALASTLNNKQSIVFFNYLPAATDGKQTLCTNISVLHDFKALEAIREKVPDIYMQINKKVSETDAGRLYLLDSLRGFQDV